MLLKKTSNCTFMCSLTELNMLNTTRSVSDRICRLFVLEFCSKFLDRSCWITPTRAGQAESCRPPVSRTTLTSDSPNILVCSLPTGSEQSPA
eukprot:592024-Hanusia_phi.AAC.2